MKGAWEIKSSTVIIPVYGNFDLLKRCLSSVKESEFDLNTPIIIWSDGNDSAELAQLQSEISGLNLNIALHGTKENYGFVSSVNSAMRLASSDIALVLNSDIEVYGSWQEDILQAFEAYSKVGTVSTLTNAGSILSTPLRNKNITQLPSVSMRKAFAQLVKTVSKSTNPIIVTPVGHLFAVDMKVWRKLDGFSMEFSPGYGEEVDFGERAISVGYKNVLADSVWVSHKNGSSFGNSNDIKRMKSDHEKKLLERHKTFLQRSSIEATSESTQLASCLRNIQQHLLLGSTISDNPFFKTEEFLALQEYLSLVYFPHIYTIGESVYRDILEKEGRDFFNSESKVIFISSVEKYYNPFRSMSNIEFEDNIKEFHNNLKSSKFLALTSSLELKFLQGLYEIDNSQIIILPKSDATKSELISVETKGAGFAEDKSNHSIRIEYFDDCEQKCDIVFCIHIITKLITQKNTLTQLNSFLKTSEPLGVYGNRLLFVRSRLMGGKFEEIFIPLNSRRRNIAKRLLHFAVRVYSAWSKR